MQEKVLLFDFIAEPDVFILKIAKCLIGKIQGIDFVHNRIYDASYSITAVFWNTQQLCLEFRGDPDKITEIISIIQKNHQCKLLSDEEVKKNIEEIKRENNFEEELAKASNKLQISDRSASLLLQAISHEFLEIKDQWKKIFLSNDNFQICIDIVQKCVQQLQIPNLTEFELEFYHPCENDRFLICRLFIIIGNKKALSFFFNISDKTLISYQNKD